MAANHRAISLLTIPLSHITHIYVGPALKSRNIQDAEVGVK